MPGQARHGPTPVAGRRRALLRLYVAGASPNSALALANLEALLAGPLAGRCELEVIAVFASPERALLDRVLVTPTLVKRAPGAPCRILGTLRDPGQVLRALGLAQELVP